MRDDQCDVIISAFFLWKKMVGQFQPQAKLEVKDLETWNIETNTTEVWAPIWDAFVIHHSSSGPLTEQIWHSLLGFGGIWEVQVQRALALCPSSGTWDNDLMNCGGTLTRKIMGNKMRSSASNFGLFEECGQKHWVTKCPAIFGKWIPAAKLIKHGNPGRGSRP